MMAWLPPSTPSRRRGLIPLLTFVIFVVYLEFLPHPSLDSWRHALLHTTSASLPCANLRSAEDIFVIVRTGATEIHHKMPVHLETTLRCVPDFAIFSDLDEEIQGRPVYDALDGLSETAMREYPELEFYRTLHKYKAEGRNISALLDKHSHEPEVRTKAWNLDKWKFLPLMSKAQAMRPDAKWYVIMEADTSLIWSNMLHWLNTLDPSEPMYIGGQTWSGDVEFGHGGSGIVISQPAMRMLVEKQARNIELFEKLSGEDWAGDLALSKAFQQVGLKLTEAFPVFQGEAPYTLDFTEDQLCHPVVTYHHMPPEWIRRVWEFEQAWIAQPHLANKTIYNRHMFDAFILPEIQSERVDWDNLSNDEQKPFHPATIENCRAQCTRNKDCVQWHFAPGTCRTNDVVRLGKVVDPKWEDDLMELNAGGDADYTKFLSSAHPTSGWMLDRIMAFRERLGSCRRPWAGAYRFD